MDIVWIHGFPLSSAIFEAQRAIKGATHHTPDLPPGLASMDECARWVLEQSPQKAIFAGLSMGGYIAFAIARMAPERVAGLILIDTRETADTPEAKKGRYDTIEKVKEKGTGVVVEAMLPKMLTPAASPALVEKVRSIMASRTKDGVINSLRAMAERPDSSDLLPRIKVPTLVIVGADDTVTPPADAQRMARAIPGAKLVTIPGAAHLSTMEKGGEVNRAVEEFSPSLMSS